MLPDAGLYRVEFEEAARGRISRNGSPIEIERDAGPGYTDPIVNLAWVWFLVGKGAISLGPRAEVRSAPDESGR